MENNRGNMEKELSCTCVANWCRCRWGRSRSVPVEENQRLTPLLWGVLVPVRRDAYRCLMRNRKCWDDRRREKEGRRYLSCSVLLKWVQQRSIIPNSSPHGPHYTRTKGCFWNSNMEQKQAKLLSKHGIGITVPNSFSYSSIQTQATSTQRIENRC